MAIPGWVVERAIPVDVLAGLWSGQYQLRGGVIRWAAGTQYGGQIVRHLIPISETAAGLVPGNPVSLLFGTANVGIGIANSMRLQDLSALSGQILQVASGAMVFSGLNLLASAITFSVLYKKLELLNQHLAEAQEAQNIKERARLINALRDLATAEDFSPDDRRHVLLQHHTTLGEMELEQRELLCKANSLDMALSREEFFCLAVLGWTRCNAELGLVENARRGLMDAHKFWKSQSQHIAREWLLGQDPERFLASDFAADLSASEIIAWMDFAHDQSKGLAWIDELRRKTAPIYSNGLIPIPTISIGPRDLQQQRTHIIPALRRLMGRNAVLETHLAQYELMENAGLTPSEFQRRIETTKSESGDGYIILRPGQRKLISRGRPFVNSRATAAASHARRWWIVGTAILLVLLVAFIMWRN